MPINLKQKLLYGAVSMKKQLGKTVLEGLTEINFSTHGTIGKLCQLQPEKAISVNGGIFISPQ